MSETKPPATKPGYKTTEFYLTLLAVLFGVLAQFGVFEPASCTQDWCSVADKALGFLVMVLATLGYQYVRTSTKNTATVAGTKTGSP